MTKPGEDELWQGIVDNYGDRPSLDDDDTVAHDNLTWTGTDHAVDELTDDPTLSTAADWYDDASPTTPTEADAVLDRYFPDEHFVPPKAPRPILPAPPRLASWLGIFLAPVIFVLWTISDFYLPSIMQLLLLAWFLGGFGYLVWAMPTDPRDPGDDGAQV